MSSLTGSTRTNSPACLLLTVEEAAHRLGIGRSTAYQLIGNGEIESIQIGHLRRIPVDALDAFVDRQRGRGN